MDETATLSNGSPESKAAADPPRNVRRIVAQMAKLALAACAVGFLAGAAARWHWGLDLFTHFTMQLLGLTAMVGAVLAVTRQWKALVCAVLLWLALIWRFLPSSELAAPVASPQQSQPLKVVLANILVHARSFRPLIEFVERESPDVLVLEELSTAGFEKLAPVLDGYPYRHVLLREDSFGAGVFSRLPLEERKVYRWAPDVPSLTCQLNFSGTDVHLIVTHPLTPMSHQQSQLRNEQLQQVAEHAASQTSPVVVIGDLNCTPWSPYFQDLLRAGRLRDTRTWRLQTTWPARLPWPARIPIDHVLVSHHWRVHRRITGPRYESDHLPVLVELAMEPSRE